MFERDLTAVAAYFHETWPTSFTRTRIRDSVATPPHAMAGALYTMEEVLDILDEPMLPGSDDEFLCDDDEFTRYVHSSSLRLGVIGIHRNT